MKVGQLWMMHHPNSRTINWNLECCDFELRREKKNKNKPKQYTTTLYSIGDFGMIDLLAIMDDGSNTYKIGKNNLLLSLETNAGLNYQVANVTCQFSLIQCNEMKFATHFFVLLIVTSFTGRAIRQKKKIKLTCSRDMVAVGAAASRLLEARG